MIPKNSFNGTSEFDFSGFQIPLQQVFSGVFGKSRLINEQELKKGSVYRLTWESKGTRISTVAKRFQRDRSHIERTLLHRWLVVTNLYHISVKLTGVFYEQSGRYVWHLYEDLGNTSLDQEHKEAVSENIKDRGFLSPMKNSPGRNSIKLIIGLVCELHDKFQRHWLLGECRHHSKDLGSHFLNTSIHDAIYALEYLESLFNKLGQKQKDVVKSLLKRLYQLKVQLPWRKRFLEKKGGFDTLLHGDLGVKNAFTTCTNGILTGKLIDWDHAGVGPVSYDLSTFLMQIPEKDRLWTLDLYQQRRKKINKTFLKQSYEEWNSLFETNEYARMANSLIWPAIDAAENQSDWAFDELAKIKGWFDDFKPVLSL